MTLYLVRHATPDRTLDIPYHTPPGPSLTRYGEEEARHVGEFLRDKGVVLIYSSSLERAKKTALLIGREICTPTKIEPAINEWLPSDNEASVRARVLPFLETLGKGTFALVTHGWIIRTILQNAGMSDEELLPHSKNNDSGNPVPCAGVWRVTDGMKPELVFAP